MKKPIFLFAILAAFFILIDRSYGQCPTGDLLIETAQDLSDFAQDYPNCTQISGDLIIRGGNSLTHISQLSKIKEVEGSLEMYGNSLLT